MKRRCGEPRGLPLPKDCGNMARGLESCMPLKAADPEQLARTSRGFSKRSSRVWLC